MEQMAAKQLYGVQRTSAKDFINIPSFPNLTVCNTQATTLKVLYIMKHDFCNLIFNVILTYLIQQNI